MNLSLSIEATQLADGTWIAKTPWAPDVVSGASWFEVYWAAVALHYAIRNSGISATS